MDRGMVSEDNLTFLREGERRYIIGTPKSMFKKFQKELLEKDWHSVREGLEVKLCPHGDHRIVNAISKFESQFLAKLKDMQMRRKKLADEIRDRLHFILQFFVSLVGLIAHGRSPCMISDTPFIQRDSVVHFLHPAAQEVREAIDCTTGWASTTPRPLHLLCVAYARAIQS